VPKKSKPTERRPPCQQKLPPASAGAALLRRPNKKTDQRVSPTYENDLVQTTPIVLAHFELRDDRNTGTPVSDAAGSQANPLTFPVDSGRPAGIMSGQFEDTKAQ